MANAPHYEENADKNHLISLRHQSDEFKSTLGENLTGPSLAFNPNGGEGANVGLPVSTRNPSTVHSAHASGSHEKSFAFSSGHVDEAESISVSRFGDEPFTPQWGMMERSRMNNAVNCRDMIKNLFTLVDYEYCNDGVPDHGALKQSWRQLEMCMQTQSNMLVRYEELSDRFINLAHAYKSCKDVQLRYRECRDELAKLQAAKDAEVVRAE